MADNASVVILAKAWKLSQNQPRAREMKFYFLTRSRARSIAAVLRDERATKLKSKMAFARMGCGEWDPTLRCSLLTGRCGHARCSRLDSGPIRPATRPCLVLG